MNGFLCVPGFSLDFPQDQGPDKYTRIRVAPKYKKKSTSDSTGNFVGIVHPDSDDF